MAESICEKCVHRNVCAFYEPDEECVACNHFDDKSRFVEPPCKVGDTVYQIDAERVYEYKVTNIVYDTPTISFDKRAIGNGSLFLTREEAEAALAERMKDGRKQFL